MTTKYIVAVYLRDRRYGGPEEGGWWYDTGELVRPLIVTGNEGEAVRYADRLNRRLERTLNKDRRPISSVLSEGCYYAEIHENVAPGHYPVQRPHYE